MAIVQIYPDYTGSGGVTADAGIPSSNFSESPAKGPLASLYSTNLGISSHVYPKDLQSNTKNHYVKFWIKEILGTGYDTTGQQIDLPGIPNLHLAAATTESKAVISLYMPDTLTATYNASYDQLSLMNDMGGVFKGLQTIKSLLDVGTDFYKGNITGHDSAAKENLKGEINAALSGSETLKDVFLQGGGVAINPQLQMIYRGVDFREFQLTFNFTPTSAAESAEVNAIIAQFKYHFAPELLSVTNSQGMFMTPPSLFSIEFMLGEKENLYLPKYGDCVLANIDVNYAPNGFAAYNNGAPVQTQLNLTFREIEIVTKSKLQKGFGDPNHNDKPQGSLR